MIDAFLGSLRALAVSAGILAVAWALTLAGDALPLAVRSMLNGTPYLAAGAGVLLAGWFHRSRAVFALIALVAVHALLAQNFPKPPGKDVLGLVVWPLVAVLLPLVLTVQAFYAERGLWTERGAARLTLIAGIAALVAVIAKADGWLEPSTAKALWKSLADLLRTSPLPLPKLTAALAALMLIGRLAMGRRAPLDGAFPGALLAAAMALATAGHGVLPSIWMLAAAVIVLAAVVEESYRMAFHDELTGLPGRRALMAELGKLGDRYVAAMLDVDHFKKFNDTHGHDVGDQVLRLVAAQLARVGGGGKAFRYGGEEFTVLFPGKAIDESLPHLEALRLAVEAASFRLRAKDRPAKPPDSPKPRKPPAETVSVTISIGAAAPDGGPTIPDDVLKKADQALYKAKQAGRNRVAS